MNRENSTHLHSNGWESFLQLSDAAELHHARPSSHLNGPSISQHDHNRPTIVEFVSLNNHTSQTTTWVEIDEPLFSPSPQEVVIDQFEAFSVVERVISFRNKDMVSLNTTPSPSHTPTYSVYLCDHCLLCGQCRHSGCKKVQTACADLALL